MVEQGEGKLLLEQIKELSQKVLSSLYELDMDLQKLQESVKYGSALSKQDIINKINEMRIKIGAMEREDAQEMEEEEILLNLIKKLDELIKMTLG